MLSREYSRRRCLGLLAAAWLTPLRASAQDDSSAGALQYPTVAGAPGTPTAAGDNDPAIRALEKRLKCPCPCGLDVYTCRTTDFTCTYSPESHRQVMALWSEGKTADQIVDAFVAEYGERALMAPPARGFNLAAYLVPSLLILLLGAVLGWAIRRRTAGVARIAPSTSPAQVDGPVVATPSELAEIERLIRDDS